MCLSSLRDTPGSFLFHHNTILITTAVDSYSLHNLKVIALLRLQCMWCYQATWISRNFQVYLEFSRVLLSYVMLIAFLVENIFLDYSLKSTIKDVGDICFLNVFLHHATSRCEGLIITKIYWSDVPCSSEELLSLTFLLQSGFMKWLRLKWIFKKNLNSWLQVFDFRTSLKISWENSSKRVRNAKQWDRDV